MQWPLAVALVATTGAGCGRVAFDLAASSVDGADAQLDARGDSAPADAAPLPSGLVARYALESATTITDEIGDRDGTCSACPTSTPGHAGTALLFDGVDDCITITDDGTFQLPQLTLAVWARQDAVANVSHVAKKVQSGGSVNSWQLETLSSPTQAGSFTTYDGSGLNQYTPSPANAVQVAAWQHIAGTYDGVTKRLYIDGVEVASAAEPTALPYDGNAVRIGCDDNSPIGQYFVGALDEVQVYGRALLAAEISDLAAR